MQKLTKQQALEKIEELKKYVQEEDKKEEKTVGIAINSILGSLRFQSTKTTIKEAVIEAVKSGADLSGADLNDADLSNADLSNAYLSDADLSGADLNGADLSGADLNGADLSGAYLRGAYLSNADLSDADLRGANLRGAEMQNVRFYGKGGTKELKRSQLPDFLAALGFIIVD
jgi:hypothetical protein